MKDIKEHVALPRKVALYARMDCGDTWYSIWEVRYSKVDEHYSPLPAGMEREVPIEHYVRVSEPIDLTFRPLTDDSIVQKAVESLNEAERKAIRELNAKIASIREQKAQLLALTHQPEPTNV